MSKPNDIAMDLEKERLQLQLLRSLELIYDLLKMTECKHPYILRRAEVLCEDILGKRDMLSDDA